MASNAAVLQSTVGNILGLAATSAEDTASATGQGYAAQGDTAEQGAYTTASAIATQNAQSEEMAGKLQQLQEQRATEKTIGTQKADIAGSGFTQSGTFLSGLKSSYQQGYLTQQLTGVQTGMTAAGYYSQAAAATGEAAAAGFASTAATALGTSYTTAAKTAAANQAAETAALMGYIGTNNSTAASPEDKLALAAINPALNPTSPVNVTPAAATWMKGSSGMSYGQPAAGGFFNPAAHGSSGSEGLPGGSEGLPSPTVAG